MIIFLLIVLVLALLLYHFFIWKPLDTSVLYKNYPCLLFGHRGAPLHEPENTIPSFQRAITDGCNAIELDVHRTRDGHLVVFHDDTLERTSNGTGRVAEHTLAELKALNAAKTWEGRQEQIPMLQEVVDALPDSIVFNFEIKNFSFFSEQRTELELVRFIRENKLRDRVVLSSFNPLNIWRVKMSDPRIFTALLWFNPSILSLRHPMGVHLSHPDLFHPFEDSLNWGVKFWSKVKKIPMHVWVVNDEERMKTFARDPMIKGIMSDNPKLLMDTVGHKLRQ
jgi:glycerophosphoryl diester phosphodiesterase